MRILIGAGNYPKLSESYIEAEIKYLIRVGHQVAVYSPVVGSPGAPELAPVFRNHEEAFREFRPEVFHAHYLTFTGGVLEAAGRIGVPVTIRGHSFDFGVERARQLASQSHIARIWLFPHFASRVNHPKVFPLPVAYDSTLYRPSKKDPRLVYRTGAGKGGKGLEDFFKISSLCPDFKFVMSANVVRGEESYMGVLSKLSAHHPVELHADIGREEAASRMSAAGIYLDTSDPNSHPFGMPISIAEALATGAYVLARHNDVVRDYLGDAGAVYGSPEEASELVNATRSWSAEQWVQVSAASIDRSALYADHAVLRDETDFWASLQK